MNIIYNQNQSRIKTLFCFSLLISFSFLTYGQKGATLDEHQAALETEVSRENFTFPNIKNYEGTYQFIFKERRNIAIHSSLLKHIEASRKNEEDVIIKIASYCDVIILSRQKINSKEFIPFQTAYKLQ